MIYVKISNPEAERNFTWLIFAILPLGKPITSNIWCLAIPVKRGTRCDYKWIDYWMCIGYTLMIVRSNYQTRKTMEKIPPVFIIWVICEPSYILHSTCLEYHANYTQYHAWRLKVKYVDTNRTNKNAIRTSYANIIKKLISKI